MGGNTVTEAVKKNHKNVKVLKIQGKSDVENSVENVNNSW